MNKVHKARLLKLADFLENSVPKKHFDLDFFTHDNDTYSEEQCCRDDDQDSILITKLKKIKGDLKQHTCGAVACAIGWMPAVFPRSFEWNENANITLRRDVNQGGFEAVDEFFGLSYLEVLHLFTSEYYRRGRRGPKAVAHKIKKFVETGKLPDKSYEDD